ncbi:Fpg/Nei family DNA glycosylase [Conexibacter arvalis]|uniref:DNA-(apurinic or apyrimidinic site) lyase n=1 Tax=Conexibacter arvalis TaxID=912552 RepID=A0A840IAT1_9ACTN|nr:Fpg/Nei family DNA glycosylase [Conexibacter arvalis]MBB4661188.1 endonuclease-8 [Conexibacter arvalis]
MPEGDTILRAARRIRPVLEGNVPDEIRTPQPRHAPDRWPQRLAGRRVTRVDPYGKHLFLRFEGGLTLHSHLRMNGAWAVYPPGARWRKSPRRAWLVVRAGEVEVVEFDGPVLELMTDSRTRFDQRLRALGPDLLADDFAPERFLRRLRADDQSRTIGDALLDQRNVAGIGNIWKTEGCWGAAVDPWRPVRDVRDEEAVAIVEHARPRMLAAARVDGFPSERDDRRVYKRAGMPCPRCGETIRARGQGDDNRITYWCPGCQR